MRTVSKLLLLSMLASCSFASSIQWTGDKTGAFYDLEIDGSQAPALVLYGQEPHHFSEIQDVVDFSDSPLDRITEGELAYLYDRATNDKNADQANRIRQAVAYFSSYGSAGQRNDYVIEAWNAYANGQLPSVQNFYYVAPTQSAAGFFYQSFSAAPPSEAPEPSSLLLVGLSILLLGHVLRKIKSRLA